MTGFLGSHWLSGSCTKEYESFVIMPVSGSLVCDPYKRGSVFSYDEETTTPNYHKVNLPDYNIVAEMTATTCFGIFQFAFQNESEGHLVINPNSGPAAGADLQSVP